MSIIDDKEKKLNSTLSENLTPENNPAGHRQRLKQRFLSNNLAGMHDYEVLELLLTYSIPRRDVKPLAKRLLAEFGSIANVFDADIKELVKVKGIAENSAILISLLRNIATMYLEQQALDVDVLRSPKKVYDFARMKLGNSNIEQFLVIFLNIKHHVICCEIMSKGTVDRTVAYPRDIMRMALTNSATGIILVHNHPTGVCEPSINDINLTERIVASADTCDVAVLDHIIVSKNDFYSFRQNGLMQQN
ncbi:DNA repair protein RadC [Lentisphaerota bacterium WC36G]|nr:DNA repair protein RadC [Lentisphaerae bacterium WC36]